MRTIDTIARVLLVIGGLNWLLFGLFEFDAVAAIFGGPDTFLADVVYVLVGLSAIWVIAQWNAMHRRWAEDHRAPPTEYRRAA